MKIISDAFQYHAYGKAVLYKSISPCYRYSNIQYSTHTFCCLLVAHICTREDGMDMSQTCYDSNRQYMCGTLEDNRCIGGWNDNDEVLLYVYTAQCFNV